MPCQQQEEMLPATSATSAVATTSKLDYVSRLSFLRCIVCINMCFFVLIDYFLVTFNFRMQFLRRDAVKFTIVRGKPGELLTRQVTVRASILTFLLLNGL